MRQPALTKEGGKAAATGPDTCIVPGTPPVPTPFPNFAQVSDADGTVDTVLISNKEVVVEDSKITSSKGDQGGSSGGVASGTVGDKVVFKGYSEKVFAAGKKMAFFGCDTAHNGSNPNAPVGKVVQPSQTKVEIAT